MARILVTGASGFTGRHLCRRLQGDGHEVIGLGSGDIEGVSSRHELDLTDADRVKDVVGSVEPEYVVHLAAVAFVAHGDPFAFYRVNVFGSLNLLDALVGTNVSRVLIASSANVYGAAYQGALSEDLCPRPVNHYAMSKLAMEHMSAGYSDRLPLIIARPFNYVGPGQAHMYVIPKIVNHFKRDAKTIELGNLEVVREYNDVEFLCDVYQRLLLSAPLSGGPVNVCSGQGYRLLDVIETMRTLTGRPMDVKVNPAFVRANEVPVLVGSAARLHALVGELPQAPLSSTLARMYAAD